MWLARMKSAEVNWTRRLGPLEWKGKGTSLPQNFPSNVLVEDGPSRTSTKSHTQLGQVSVLNAWKRRITKYPGGTVMFHLHVWLAEYLEGYPGLETLPLSPSTCIMWLGWHPVKEGKRR